MTGPYEVSIDLLDGETALAGNALRFEAEVRDASGSLASLAALTAAVHLVEDDTPVDGFSGIALPVVRNDGYTSPGRFGVEFNPSPALEPGEYLIRFYAPVLSTPLPGHLLAQKRFRVASPNTI